ncbi:hypothetical protein D9M73_91430 [compost metagenome]
MDRDAVERAHQPVDDRAVAQLEPPGTARFADDDGSRPRLADLRDQTLQYAARRDRGDGRAEIGGKIERIGHACAGFGGERGGARGFDDHRGPARTECVGQALGRTDQRLAARLIADCDDDALAPGPGAAFPQAGDMVEQMAVDRLRGAAQRQFAERRQVRFGKEVAERARRLGGDIDLAVLQPVDQLVGREIDHFDLGIVQHRIGHGLAHPHAGEAGDDVVEALDMLDVERGEHVDTRRAQFLDILPAFGMAAAGGVGMGEFVYERDLRMPLEHRVEIEFLKRMRAMQDFRARQNLERGGEPVGIGSAMRFDNACDDVGAGAQQLRAFAQHLEGLADARGRPQENLETTSPLPLGGFQQGIGGGAGLVHFDVLAESRSSCRLNSRTLTCGSPMMPSTG